ncbi:MAG: hypothetical protein EXR79_07285 [Myxococcales bacterium]|nr:hypothetical protein [Myxococcales bacterium]
MRTLILSLSALATLLVAAPATALDVYINGTKATGLKNVDLVNCQVRFDGDGNLHIISPGYTIQTDKDGVPRLGGESDLVGVKDTLAGKLKMRYVLVYRPNPKVNYQFDVSVNNKPFKKIGLDQGPFTVEVTQDLRPGANTIKVVGKPGDAPPAGNETDVATLQIFRGEEKDGRFVAKPPAVWEFARAAIDRTALDRAYSVVAE